MKDIESIKSKIKKLLALSEDNPSEAESYAALQKAQELMAQYKLEMIDIKDVDDKKKLCIKKKTTVSFGTRSSDHYRTDLADIIAENFCCIHYMSTPRGSRTHYISFMGMEDDVAIAEEVLIAADMAIIRGYNKVYKELYETVYDYNYIPARIFNPIKKGYIDGYLKGLREALESQKEKHEEWGLVLVVPQEAKDYLSGLKGADFGSDSRSNRSYFSDGYRDGKNFNLNKKIESGNPTLMIE